MSCVYLAVDSLRLCNQIIQFSRRWEMLIIASGRCGLDTRVAVFQQGYPPAPPHARYGYVSAIAILFRILVCVIFGKETLRIHSRSRTAGVG